MKNKEWISDVVLFILWTTTFVIALADGNVSVIEYALMYLALFIELLENFLKKLFGK